jgi:hypothetical protein
MRRLRFLALVLCAIAWMHPALAAEDSRTKIDLPPEIRELFLEEMRTHMVSLDNVVQLLASGKPKEAGALARKEMAFGRGKGLGRFMPPEFRELGFAFHRAADHFARTADKLPAQPSAEGWIELMGSLAAVTTTCSGCHAAFTVR